MTDDDDPVVNEIPVILSGSTGPEILQLFQFPTRPIPFDAATIPKEGRSRHCADEFQLMFALNASANIEGPNKQHHGWFDDVNSKLEAIKLQSTKAPLNSTYMVGTVKDNVLHLRQISAIQQLRPMLDYIDSHAERKTSQKYQPGDATNPDEKPIVHNVIQHYVDSDDKEAHQKSLVADYHKSLQLDPWVNIELFPPQSSQSTLLRSNLELIGTQKPVGNDSTCSADPVDYLDSICDPSVPTGTSDTIDLTDLEPLAPKVRLNISLKEALRLPIEDRIIAVLIHAHVVHFDAIYSYVGQSFTRETFLESLTKVAYFIQGSWVIKSELLYSGRPLDARNVLLGLFNRNKCIRRKDFVEATHLLPNMAKNMLCEIACLCDGLEWILKLEPDASFIANNVDLVRRQSLLVQQVYEAALKKLSYVDGQPMKVTAPSNVPVVAKKSAGASSIAKKVVPAGFAAIKDSDEAKVHKETDATKNSSSPEIVGPSQLIIQTRGSTIQAKVSYMVKDYLTHHGACTATFLRKSTFKVLQEELKSEFNEKVIQAAFEEAIKTSCTNIRNVVVLRKLDSSLDSYRDVVVEMFLKKEKIRRADIMAEFTAKNLDAPNSKAYKAVMDSIAENKGPTWTLKPSPVFSED